MILIRLTGLLLVLSVYSAFADQAAGQGRLVIGGGALERGNAAVWQALIQDLPDNGRVAVIPGASAEPARAVESLRQTLAQYGVAPERVEGVRLALVDDPSTPETDEAGWASNASDPDEIERIASADIIWMTGGDQARLADLLLTAEGHDTPMLTAMRARLAAGATVGGSSAGAAILSCPMISRGDTLTALAEPVIRGARGHERDDTGALVIESGVCLFKQGLVDQHFDRQARLGRLARALGELPHAERRGFGIDENTVLIADQASGSLRVEGAGSVTILDGRAAELGAGTGQGWTASGLRVSILSSGDAVDPETWAIRPADFKAPIAPGKEYHDRPAPDGAGMALPHARLDDMLGEDLVDNSASRRIERLSFAGNGNGVRYVFAQDEMTAGAWGRDAAGRGRYTLEAVLFGIEPAKVTVQE